MKKLLALFAVLALGMAGFAQTNNTIAVLAPKTMNIGNGNEWIPLFIQGVITSNFQQYSGMKVVDRQNADMVKAEQRLSEGAEFDEKSAIELGKMTSARLIITGNITGKSASYALMFSITDAETGETKATATVPNCLFSALENGEAANQISYDLMTGYGVKLGADAKAKLTQKASVMSAETTAQASVAKGIVAEKSGSNIEALTYYIQAKKNDKRLSEAASRASAMSTAVASGNFGAQAKNLIKMRNDWEKLLTEAAELIKSNPPTFELLYYTDVTPGKIDYDKGTMEFAIDSPVFRQNNKEDTLENIKLAKEMKEALAKIPESKDWGSKINGFPGTYDVAWKGGYYSFDFLLLDSNRKTIGICEKEFSVFPRTSYPNVYRTADWFPKIDDEWAYSYNPLAYYDSDKWVKRSRITFIVSVNDADTDNLYISVENPFKSEVNFLGNKLGKKATDDVTAITPFKSDGPMSYAKACSVIVSGNHNGTVKIIGSTQKGTTLSMAVREAAVPVSIDMSELEVIYMNAFEGCKSLKGIVLPRNLVEIPDYAFKDCTSLESITIPASVEDIRMKAFAGCKSLKTLTILGPFYYCSPDAFEGCKFDTVNFPGTKDDWKGLKKVIVIKAKKINYNYKGE